MDQAANVRGFGNVVVQTIGDGNTINFAPHLPALWLTTYDTPLWADVPSVPASATPAPGYTATGLEEAALLSPFTRKLTLLGRDMWLRDLTAWLDGPDPISVQAIVGGGGRGKTRLALELCDIAAKRGHLAGFVTGHEMSRFCAQHSLATWGWTRPVLVVIDYAAAKAGAIGDWLAGLSLHACGRNPDHPKLRLLLLERHGDRESTWLRLAFGEDRSAAGVIRRMVAPRAPLRLGLVNDSEQRMAIFHEAFRLASGRDPPEVPGLDHFLNKQSFDGEPLFLAMSGLNAARCGMDMALSQEPDDLAMELAKQELRRIRSFWIGHNLVVSNDKRLDYHLAALSTLSEGISEPKAHKLIQRESNALHLALPGGTEPIRAALHLALPMEGGGIAPILPDILGEAALIAAWGDTSQGVEAVRRLAADGNEAVARVVLRTCQHFLVRGHRAPMDWLKVVREGISDVAGLIALANAMPDNTPALLEASIEIIQTILDATPVEDGGSDELLSLRASSLNNLSNRLSDLRHQEGARSMSEMAAEAYGGHPADNSGVLS